MKSKELKMFSFADFFVFCAVALLALILIFSGKNGEKSDTLQITSENGKQTLSLSEDAVFTLEGHGITLSVVIENGEAFVSESTCPDGICKQTGKISKKGQTIVCAPAEVAIKVVSDGEDGIDAITH